MPSLVRVLGRQTRHKVGLLPHAFVRFGAEAVHTAIERLRSDGIRYAIADATDDEDLHVLARAARDLPLLVGGSGIALGLPENARARGTAPARDLAEADVPRGGPALVLAGSCSQATRGQVDWFSRQHPARRLDAAALVAGRGELDAATRWLHEHVARGPCLIHSSAAPADVQALQDALGTGGRERAAAAIESAFAHLARQAVAAGVRRLVVAGGETSGAVVQALGIEALAIGAEIDPGVPWTATPGDRSARAGPQVGELRQRRLLRQGARRDRCRLNRCATAPACCTRRRPPRASCRWCRRSRNCCSTSASARSSSAAPGSASAPSPRSATYRRSAAPRT